MTGTRRFLGALVTAVSLFSMAGHLRAEVPVTELILRCPDDGASLCRWSEGEWSRVWGPAPDGLGLLFFEVLGDRPIVGLHLQPHNGPGTIVLLDEQYDEIREISTSSYALGQLVGVTPAGEILLCHGETPVCEVIGEPASHLRQRFEFPPGCIVPRFLPDSRAVCIAEGEAAAMIVVQRSATSQETVTIELPFEIARRVRDLVPVSDSLFFLQEDGSLLAVREGQSVYLEEETALEVRAIDGGVVYSTVVLSADLEITGFEVKVAGEDLSTRTVWSSSVVVPQRLVPVSDGQVILRLDEWKPGEKDEPPRAAPPPVLESLSLDTLELFEEGEGDVEERVDQCRRRVPADSRGWSGPRPRRVGDTRIAPSSMLAPADDEVGPICPGRGASPCILSPWPIH